MSRRNRNEEDLPAINKVIKNLGRSTEAQYSAVSQVEHAFLLGLWYKSFPDYTHGHIEKAYCWNHMELMPEGTRQYEDPYQHFLRFQFTADTGDSWHQCYRDFRELGWQRLKVHRDGGRLQYLLCIEGAPDLYPEGFHQIHLILDIAIATCKTIQIGTEMKEVPVMKTICEDLKELPEDTPDAGAVATAEGGIPESTKIIPLVVIDDIEELQSRRSGDSEELKDNIPF